VVRRLIILGALLVLTTPLAQAQALQRLHVRSFTLTSDTTSPQLEVPFSVTLTIRVAEDLPQMQNVYLPTFIGPEELGDERQLSRSRSGTVYRETLRLVAHARGPLTIGSAYLDAVDARDGKPKRFVSNDLHLVVGTSPLLDAWRPLRTIAWALAALVAVVALSAGVLRLAARLPVRPPAAASTPLPVAAVEPPGPSLLDAALSELRARRDRSSIMRVRSVLWHIAGAKEGQTLGDVLRRPEAGDDVLRRMLLAVERAAFIEDERMPGAIDDVLSEREGSFA
jgi:hypothetical protein